MHYSLKLWSRWGRSTLAVSDQELQLRLVQMLLGSRGPNGGSEPASPDESSYAPGNNSGQQQRSVQSGLKAEALSTALPHEQHDRYLTLLLQREVQRYAAQVCACALAGYPPGLPCPMPHWTVLPLQGPCVRQQQCPGRLSRAATSIACGGVC